MQPQPTSRSPLRALIVLNAVLVLVLAAVTFAPSVAAQVRARGEYTMVAGGAPNTINSIVYIVDTVNQEMVVVQFDSTSRTLEGIAYRDLSADAGNVARGRAGG